MGCILISCDLFVGPSGSDKQKKV